MTDHLRLSGIGKRYGGTPVLQDINLFVAAGSRTAIVGPSGSGKTTLLRIIAGFEAPSAGQLSLGGNLLADDSRYVAAHLRSIGFVPQEGALFPHLNVADNIGFGLPRNGATRQGRIHELMDMVALDRVMLSAKPHEISGGQQQRVALARALAMRPKLILLDEPFSALDTGLRAATRMAVAELLERTGIASILVTHDQAEALSFADQVAVMRAGRLVQVGTPKDVYQRPIDAQTATFLGDAIILPATLEEGRAHCVLGNLPVWAPQSSGLHEIMLRPEQLTILEGSQPAPADGKAIASGVITQLQFLGSTSVMYVRLWAADERALPLAHGYPDSTATIAVNIPTHPSLSVGSEIRLAVSGLAHLLQGPDRFGDER